jgi:hypothetical protein
MPDDLVQTLRRHRRGTAKHRCSLARLSVIEDRDAIWPSLAARSYSHQRLVL